jgi:hypothetical protein
MTPVQLALGIISGIFGFLVLAYIVIVAIGFYCQWRMNRLWAKMTPGQRVAIRCKEMAEAIRNNN